MFASPASVLFSCLLALLRSLRVLVCYITVIVTAMSYMYTSAWVYAPRGLRFGPGWAESRAQARLHLSLLRMLPWHGSIALPCCAAVTCRHGRGSKIRLRLWLLLHPNCCNASQLATMFATRHAAATTKRAGWVVACGPSSRERRRTRQANRAVRWKCAGVMLGSWL